MWHSALCFLSTSAVPLRLGLQSVHAAKPRSCLQSLSWTGFARLPTAATPVSSDGSDPCVHPHTMKTSPAGKLAMGRELLNALVHYSCRKFAAASSRRVSQPGCHHGQQRNLIRGGMWMHAAHMQPTVATTHLLYPSFPRLATCPNFFHWPIVCHGHHVPILFSYLIWQSKANSAIPCHGHLHDPARRTHSKWTAELTSS